MASDGRPLPGGERLPRCSTVRLPERAPDGVVTVLDFFLQRFPRVAPATWRARFAAGQVWSAGGPLTGEQPFARLLEVHYRREVDVEPPVRSDVREVYQDDDLLVVDKPPFLPVTPGGAWVRHCLLHLLADSELAPLHRLDRLTSGLVVLSRRRATRAHFAGLLQAGAPVEKVYTAVCEVLTGPPPRRAVLAGRIERSRAAYWRQELVPGPVNAETEVELLEHRGRLALLGIRPRTGRKHQIRVQLAAAGWPVLGDPLYGTEPRHDPDDLSRRMWLDAHCLAVRGFALPGGAGLLEAEWRSSRSPETLLERALEVA